MKNLKALIILCALALAFGGGLASAQDATKLVPRIDPPKVDPTKPADTAKPGRSEVPDAVKKVKDDFKRAHKTHLEGEKALLKQVKEASKEKEREALRDKIKENRQEFLDKQKATHEDIKRQAAELREKLKDHREVIDEAKEKAKERGKARKGGDQ